MNRNRECECWRSRTQKYRKNENWSEPNDEQFELSFINAFSSFYCSLDSCVCSFVRRWLHKSSIFCLFLWAFRSIFFVHNFSCLVHWMCVTRKNSLFFCLDPRAVMCLATALITFNKSRILCFDQKQHNFVLALSLPFLSSILSLFCYSFWQWQSSEQVIFLQNEDNRNKFSLILPHYLSSFFCCFVIAFLFRIFNMFFLRLKHFELDKSMRDKLPWFWNEIVEHLNFSTLKKRITFFLLFCWRCRFHRFRTFHWINSIANES